MPESIGNPEVIEDEVIELMKERGMDDPEVQAKLIAWVAAREEEAREDNTSESTIRCSVKVAVLYGKAGYTKEALNELDQSLEMAQYDPTCDYSLVEKIQNEIDRLQEVFLTPQRAFKNEE